MRLTGAVDGLPEVTAALARIAAVVEPPVLTGALEAAADVFVTAIRQAAPVGSPDDGDEHPGQLRDSIDKTSVGPTAFEVGPTGDANFYAGTVEYGREVSATSAPYLEFLSNGVVFRTKTVHIPAHPFFENAAQSAEAPAFAAFAETIAAALDL